MFLLVGMSMTGTVQFNGETCFFTIEIEKVKAFVVLAAEFVVGETTVTQPAPHKLFRPSFLFTECAGAFNVGHNEKVKDTVQK